MLEQLFSLQNQEQGDISDPMTRTTKRRRTHDGDEEDVAYYTVTQGKKSKGGTGYDGEITEDASRVPELIIDEA